MHELVAETQGFERGLFDGLGLALRWEHGIMGKQDIFDTTAMMYSNYL